LQDSGADLKGVEGRRFGESKLVFDALRRAERKDADGESDVAAVEQSEVTEGTPGWLDQQIGSYKGRLTNLVTEDGVTAALHALAADSVRTYRTAVQSMDRFRYRNVCDLIFVAISALIRVWDNTNNHTALIQASFLGEALLKDNQHIHEAKVILIHLYMRLDLAAQAMRHWDSLSVKEVQFDTIGHAFLTRLSVVHPHKITTVKTKYSEPHAITANALAMYHRCEEKLAQTCANVLTNGQTGMLFELQELRENLRMSTTRRLISLEQRRLARLFKQPLDMKATQITPRLTAQWLAMKDNRDFKAAFDYGYNVERVLHDHSKPETWILYALAADTVWCVANGLVAPVKDAEILLEHLDKTTTTSGSDASSLSRPELHAGQLSYRMLQLLVTPSSISSKSITELTTLLTNTDLSFLNDTTSDTPSFPLNLRQHYIHIDTLRTIPAFATHLLASTSKPPPPKKDLTALQAKATELFARIQKHAADQTSRLQVPHVRLCLQQAEGLWKVLQEFGEDAIREFGAGIVEAAKSGWKGVGTVELG
jgi:N-terminal acetyltransferase B complex non-catalytic subunit